MNKKIHLILILGLIYFTQECKVFQDMSNKNLLEHHEMFYKGTIECPHDFDLSSRIKIYYKGDAIPLKNGSFILNDDANTNIFNIIFTEGACLEFVKSATSTTRLAHITTHSDCHARYFHLSRKTIDSQQEKNHWDIQEIEINKHPFKIPRDRTIIILMNPHYLGEDTNTIFKNTETSSSKTVVCLPTIILKHLSDMKNEEQSALISQLCAIDLNTVHASNDQKECPQKGGARLTMYRKA